jgi:D-alanine-D-alanine ligase
VHGRLGEDGCLQGLLEVRGLAYVGSGVLASALAMSKPHAKAQLRAAGLPVARDVLAAAPGERAASARELRATLGRAVVVKPAEGGSAIGVGIVGGDAPDAALEEAVRLAFAHGSSVLVEQLRPGKEVTCAVLEDPEGEPRALPPTLIVPRAAGWYDFRSKYAAQGSVHECPAPFAGELLDTIREAAVAAHRALGCRDLSRVDFVVDDAVGEFTVLEVNTLPGMTATSLFPEAAAVAGITFPQLCDRLVRRAHARPRVAAPLAEPMPA